MASPDTLSHPLDQALLLERVSEHTYQGSFPDSYANFIGPYGGIIAAKLLQAILDHPERQGDPLAVTINYASAVADGVFDVSARPTCTKRSSQHWQLELRQNGAIPITGSAVFAHRRDTWSDQERLRPTVAPPSDFETLRFDGMPRWVYNYDMRIIKGNMAFADKLPQAREDSESLLWVRDHPGRALDFSSLMAISDVFFPRVFVRRPAFVPVGTMSLTTYFHATGCELAAQGDHFLLARAKGNRFNNGYFDQSGELWGENGALLATTHQVVYYKE